MAPLPAVIKLARGRRVLLVLWLSASPIALRAQGAPYVPLGSHLDRLVRWAVDDGAFAESLDPLTRPWRLDGVRNAAAREDTTALSPMGRRSVSAVAAELARLAPSAALVAEVGAAGYENGRRDSFRPGGGRGSAILAGVWALLSEGPFIAVVNPAIENRLLDDPEFTGFKRRIIAGRNQTAYVAVSGDHGDLALGRFARQWGPDLFDGLLVSPAAYAIDALSGALRLSRFELSAIAQRLDDDTTASGTAREPFSRYFFAHRLSLRAGHGLWISLSETGVYGGKGRGSDPAFLSPVNLGLLSEYNDGLKVNSLWGADVAVRLSRSSRLQASVMLDDIQVDRQIASDFRPASYGFTVVLRHALSAFPIHVAVGYTRVSSLAYRNSIQVPFAYALHGVGLGRNFSDYDQALVRIESHPFPGWHGALDAQFLRQGAGDFRDPFPPDSVLRLPGQGFLLPPVHRAFGLRLSAEGELRQGLELRAELGFTGTTSGRTQAIAALSAHAALDLLRGTLGSPWRGVEAGANREWP